MNREYGQMGTTGKRLPISTARTGHGTTFPQFVARARQTAMHGKPSGTSTVHMTLARAVELAAEAAHQTWVQQLP